jgi:hypothetical protein
MWIEDTLGNRHKIPNSREYFAQMYIRPGALWDNVGRRTPEAASTAGMTVRVPMLYICESMLQPR